jgi:hypothetical protein
MVIRRLARVAAANFDGRSVRFTARAKLFAGRTS